MENTKLVPTKVTDKTKYYAFKNRTLTIADLKELINQSYFDRYDIDFYESETSQKLIIKYKEDNTSRFAITLKSIYEVSVQDTVAIELKSLNFNLTFFEEVDYISLITF
jgi:hypothetical protein